MRGFDRRIRFAAVMVGTLAIAGCSDEGSDDGIGDGGLSSFSDGGAESGDDTGADATGGGETGGGDDGTGGEGPGDDGPGDGDDSGGTDSGGDGADSGDDGDSGDGDTGAGDTGGGTSDQIALFAINEGNFNGDTDQGIWSIMTGCSGPSFDAYMAKVAEFPELSDAKHFVTGWSCGATFALIHGFQHSDVFEGIVHLNQASVPGYQDLLEDAWVAGGEKRVPVYVIHDFGYDAGGAYTIQWLESKGYQEGVDLFVMDRPGTGHEPYLTDDQKATLAEWFRR